MYSLFGREKLGRFSELAGCQMPPPCNIGYSQFRMPGTNTMCCRPTGSSMTSMTSMTSMSTAGRPTSTRRKPCKGRKVRCGATGRCVLRKNAKKCGMTRSPGKFDNAVKILKENYSTMIKGKKKSPAFISNRTKVTGKNTAEKIANIRRVLSTCKRAGINLVKVDRSGNPTGFKAFSTLVNQCNVTFSRESQAGSILSDAKGGRSINRLAGLLKAQTGSTVAGRQKALGKTVAGMAAAAARARSAAMERNRLNETFEQARNTPLPGDEDINALDFGRRRTRFGLVNYGGRARFGRIRFG